MVSGRSKQAYTHAQCSHSNVGVRSGLPQLYLNAFLPVLQLALNADIHANGEQTQ